MKRRFFVAAASSLVISLGTLSGCATQPNNTTKTTSTGAVSGGKIVIDEPDEISTLDPAIAYTLYDDEIVFQMYDQLVTYKPGTSTIAPDLATSWDISPDGKTYTFHLAKGVKFWNGDSVTAQSFIDEFERVLSKRVNSPGEGFIDPIIEGSTAYHNGQAKDVSGLSAPNDDTLVIKLTKPEPFFLQVLAQEFFSAVDMKYINSVGNAAFAFKPMGTGPFELKSYKQGQMLTLVKNPHYFIPNTPKLDEVDISIQSNETISAMRFEQGTTAFIDYNQNIDSQDFISMMKNPKYKGDFYKEPLNTLGYLNINNQLGPFKNKLVRQAVNYAINRQQLVQLQNGRATEAYQILPPNMPGYESNLPSSLKYAYNPQKAKELLREAGYKNGFSTEILTPNDESTVKLVESIQADLDAVGIKTAIKPVTLSAYSPLAQSGKEPLVYEIWSQDFPDPYDFLDSFLNKRNIPSINFSFYDNPTVNKELDQAANMAQGPARIALYQKIQNQALADAALAPLYYPVQYAVVQPWVKGFYMNPVHLDPLQDISVVTH
ncbi:ABC transporter substrate-binding protein [Alicyclobacillus fastidiosus]|uniref:ABC transporter substrate-binding protein n=1 Tax=Alicyclobacillus fastidiosus TaxID=392011 RepID=A0ABY6ZLE6_9BACL|nr:ABC transporter substrate-binding protein [Alicyclobacillus fastidiosus]WAH43740.1 ABC transporter substrate-binding protein [Alicyclobacillus fastidiosus]GMA59954.1 peptide ABC transporter substrate-binding protein [Alicyclobacillus fastidiosus]